MLGLLKKLLGYPTDAEKAAAQAKQTEEAPYKVETPAAAEPAKCGCGRSPTGYCVGLHKLTQEEWAAHPDNPVKPVAPVEEKPAKAKKEKAPKAPAPKKAPAEKKPAAKKTAAPKKSKA